MTDTVSTSAITDTDEREIRELVQRAHEAQNDPDALTTLHTTDTVIVNLAGRRVLGRAAFADAMRAALTSPLSEVRTTVAIIDIRPAAPNVAIVSCVKTVHDGRATAETTRPLPSTGALTYVVSRAEGRWHIALAQTTPILVAPTDGD